MTVSKEILEKIRQVSRQEWVSRHSIDNIGVYYFWYGYWKENRKSCTVFLGSELPEELRRRIERITACKSGKVHFYLKSPVCMLFK